MVTDTEPLSQLITLVHDLPGTGYLHLNKAMPLVSERTPLTGAAAEELNTFQLSS